LHIITQNSMRRRSSAVSNASR